MDMQEFLDRFKDDKTLKVLGCGYNNITERGWIEVLNENGQSTRLYSS